MSLQNDHLTELVTRQLEVMLDPQRGGALLTSTRTVREGTSQDFAEYRFFAPPQTERVTGTAVRPDAAPDPGALAEAAEAYADGFLDVLADAVGRFVPDRVQRYALVPSVNAPMGRYGFLRRADVLAFSDAALAHGMRQGGFGRELAPALYALRLELGDSPEFAAVAAAAVTDAVRTIAAAYTLGAPGEGPYVIEEELSYLSADREWADRTDAAVVAVRAAAPRRPSPPPPPGELPPQYPFASFRAGTVNFAVQLVYRQDWTPLGTQAGEIVRTLPLGPRQTERITVEAVSRTKRMLSSELSTSAQQTSEAGTATKDATEVATEASSSFNWHVEASGGFNVGFGSADLKAGAGGDSADSSKATKSKLSEVMDKSAAQLRRDTKIVVTTETETSRQTTSFSEIVNPNDEVAVTYVYSRLQRQYELHTYLQAVNTCVLYAEPLPAPSDLTADWIRRHDWILARVLLDESFRPDLDTVVGDPGDDEADGVDGQIDRVMSALADDLPDLGATQGTVPDYLAAPQAAYEREVERRRARAAGRRRVARALARLRQHFYANVLHYMRAVWASEDADARRLRHAAVRVPVRWTFATAQVGEGLVGGTWSPDVVDAARDTMPLSELVQAGGPVGYVGNYAVLPLAAGRTYPGLDAALTDLRMPYLRHVARGSVAGQAVAVTVAVGVDRRGPGGATFTWKAATGTWTRAGSRPAVTPDPDGALTVDGLRIVLGAPPQDGWVLTVEVDLLPVLEDPELRALRASDPVPPPGAEAEAYPAEVLAEHAEHFPEVAAVLRAASEKAGGSVGWTGLDAAARAVVRARWPQYLLRRAHTRRLLLDTNNVVLTRVVEPASSLEPFRGILRYVDVLQAYEAANQRRIDNERRAARIAAGLLGDPDVETVVSANGEVGIVVDPNPDPL